MPRSKSFSPLAITRQFKLKSLPDLALVAGTAIKAAGVVGTLFEAGPFTVFAPTNSAFTKLPAAAVGSLRPENKTMLQGVMTHHVVPGRLTAADLLRCTSAEGGGARVPTVASATLTARMIYVTDSVWFPR